jgi:hypothetical protein
VKFFVSPGLSVKVDGEKEPGVFADGVIRTGASRLIAETEKLADAANTCPDAGTGAFKKRTVGVPQ